MTASLDAGHPIRLEHIDDFVDGAAVEQPGDLPFQVIKQSVEEGRVQITTVTKGQLCATMADLFQEGRITEPAGALSVAAIDQVAHDARNGIICIISGNNFDVRRMPAVLEHAALHRRTKAYLEVQLPDRPGQKRKS